MNYHVMREFADSWGLLFMFAFFFCAAMFALFRPNAKKFARDAAEIPFKEDESHGR
ncbi:cytochrome c oxidase cbb3-type subunit 4 [Kaistia hirudinis]|uniref:Cytochrome c oxidase cbb3-type subunit 4 n=1 Tax=Kaistia hirudinis TaxID=1293440 RepID=A0A840ALY8_9HYPH|nr:CcoQ/FixQ family Cbb3-type cytochrome c oxidase assembly chaperone [Kaistia hirudinis]MBB3930273.1 cytochrome c oxidase cbb3-type subunit 4 [Kaistia hirudinis]MBN9017833.1 CcoQ/FixQ family Cbb3-type cytochrome c oxidase assembly chaperone [Hyphomicrobiales bacterium]